MALTAPAIEIGRRARDEIAAGKLRPAPAGMNSREPNNMNTNTLKPSLNALPESVRPILRLLTIRPLRFYFRYFPFSFGKLALWKRTAAHLWWLESHVKARTVFGSDLRVDANDIVGKYIYYFGKWEPNLTSWISQRLKPGDVFIDVGANVGYFSSLASKLLGDSGKVVAVEALPETFGRLKENLEMNGARNVRFANAAAWHKEEQVKIFTQPENPSGTTTLIQDWAVQWHLQQHVEVTAKPLPAILTPDEIKQARLIKIDVEGAEWNVVSGMASMMPACRHDLEIIMEVSRSMLEAHGKTGQDLLNVFSGWGFHPYHIVNDYSPAAYITQNAPPRPKRIERIFEEPGDQMDVIFSRIDAASL